MIPLHKEVKRITGAVHKYRNIVVGMRPPSILTFRLKGTRKEYVLGVVDAFELSVKIEAAHIAKAKKEIRKARAAARRKGVV